MAFTRWYPVPFQLAFWEVMQALDQTRFRTVHCDPQTGWVLADTGIWLIEVGLVDVSVRPHPTFGTTVSATAEPYWSTGDGSMRRSFDGLVRTIDQRTTARAHHYAAALKAAEVQGVKFNLEKGTDLSSRAKPMGRPRAFGAIALAILIGVLFMLPIPLQDAPWKLMVYVSLAMPFLTSAGVIAAGKSIEGGWFLLSTGIAIAIILSVFTRLLSVIILHPALKGASKAFRADHLTGRWRAMSEGSRSKPKVIEFEHR